MSINVDDTVRWSELNWEMCWQDVLEIKDILPKNEFSYPVTFFPHQQWKKGEISILWKPPQSDINGWSENRPSEILKSYVVSGEVQHVSSDTFKAEFRPSSRIKLTDLFEMVEEDTESPLEDYRKGHSLRASVGVYTYYINVFEYGSFEAIFSTVDNRLCVHFTSQHCEYTTCTAKVTRYFLTPDEKTKIEKRLSGARLIVDSSADELPESQVFGAIYQ